MTRPRNSGGRRRGVILAMFGISIVVLVGIAGLAVDLGRMYLARNEAQSYVDAGALAAAQELNGMASGITAAVAAAGEAWKPVSVHTLPAPTVTFAANFSTDPAGYMDAAGAQGVAATIMFARVQTSVNVPIFFMQVLTGQSASTVGAVAVGTQQKMEKVNSGLIPFTPLAHTAVAGEAYGFVAGQEYTIRWGANSMSELEKLVDDPVKNYPTDWCKGDFDPNSDEFVDADELAWVQANLTADEIQNRGYFESTDIDGNASTYRDIVQNGLQGSLNVGEAVEFKNAEINAVISELEAKAALDSDQTEFTNWGSYTGNYSRLVFVPVTRAATADAQGVVLGFVPMMLKPAAYYDKIGGNDSVCADYVPGAQMFTGKPSVSPVGIWFVRLVQ